MSSLEAKRVRTISLFSAPAIPVSEEGPDWIPVRRELGVDAFGVNAYRAARAGDTVIEEHVESPGQEELYIVLAGSARFEVDDDSFEVKRGEALFVPHPQARRVGVAQVDETTVLAVGGWPGSAYHSLPWEPIYLAQHAAREGDWEHAAEILENESGSIRDSAFVRYHLARAKARLGEDDAALNELRQAVESNRDLLGRAEDEEAFAQLRQSANWPR
jgi:hypothetical protein